MSLENRGRRYSIVKGFDVSRGFGFLRAAALSLMAISLICRRMISSSTTSRYAR